MAYALDSNLLSLRGDAELLLATASDADSRDAARRLVALLEGLATMDRMDVYYRESGCDCCSGDYSRGFDRHGEYLLAEEFGAALTDAVRSTDPEDTEE